MKENPKRVQKPVLSVYQIGVALFIGYILGPIIVSNTVILINPLLPPAYQMLVQQVSTVLIWLMILTVFAYPSPSRLFDFLGLKLAVSKSKTLWYSTVLCIVSIALTFGLSFLWQALEFDVAQNNPYKNLTQSQFFILTFFATVVAPLQEELIFRGLVQSTLRLVSGPVKAIGLTTLVFLLFHGSYANHVPALLHVTSLGLCFAIAREKTGSLIPGIIAHFLNNTLASVLLFKQLGH
ncbi:MAG: type II CAAX endopeptidase family protein [Cyanobacteria bacterium P01_H01_bin.74]